MPNKRQFRLENVRRLRQQKERKLQGELAEVYRRQLEQDRLLMDMKENRQSQIDLLERQLRADRVEMTYIQFGHAYLDRLESLIERQTNVAKQAARITGQKRAELVEAMRSRKVIDKLKERWWQALLEEENQAEIKRLDEIATVQYNRNPRES